VGEDISYLKPRGWQMGYVVDKVASGQVFSEYFGFPCQNHSFHQLHHHHHNSKIKRKIEVLPIGEEPRVAPLKGAQGSKVSKLAQRNVDF
jgi:hypothetical protein